MKASLMPSDTVEGCGHTCTGLVLEIAFGFIASISLTL